jgi:serine/threonine protein kinase/Flp pilus assembly protein TadD
MRRCQKCNKITNDDCALCPDDQTPLVEDTLATSLQEALGAKYTLTKLIGKGAMGAVYRARHRDLDDVAIKVMLGPADNAQLSERFLREAKALRRLRHQHAVTIYDLDRSVPGITYMVMEIIEGGSLRQDLRSRGHLTLEEVMEVAEAVCGALSAAHDRGIIHRDLKPDNILVAEEVTVSGRILRTVKIADFGIVKLRANNRDGDTALKLTQIGTPIGTPFYMSPEQWFGEGAGINALDGRTDIYALGCTLYELLSGRTPFLGKTSSELRRQHLERDPQPLSQIAPHVPEPVSRVIMRALEKDRDDRHQTVAEFFADLRRAYNESRREALAIDTQDDLPPTEVKSVDEVRPREVKTPRLPDTNEAMLAEADTARSEEDRRAEEARQAEAARQAEEARQAEAARQAEEARQVEEARQAEEARAAQEAAADKALEASIIGYDAEITAVRERSTDTQPDFTDAEITIVPGSLRNKEASWTNQVGADRLVAEAELPPPPPLERRRLPGWVWIAMLALVFIGVGLAAGFGVYLYRQRTLEARTETARMESSAQPKTTSTFASTLTGTLRINAPIGSEVFVDDEKVGVTGEDGSFTAQTPVGVRNVRVNAPGYRPWIRDTGVTANLTTSLKPELKGALVAARQSTDEERQKRAEDFFRGKNYYAAEVEYRELLKASPNDAALHMKLAESLNAQKRYNDAIPEYEQATRLDQKNLDALLALASLYSIKGRDADAEATLRRAVKLAPTDADAHNALAWVLQRNPEKLDEALEEIERALKIRRHADFLDTKAYILLARNSLDEALKTEQRALALDNKDPMFRAGVAVILYRMGRADEAITSYRELRQAAPNAEWGDIKRLEMLRGYSRPVLETFAALIAQTN